MTRLKQKNIIISVIALTITLNCKKVNEDCNLSVYSNAPKTEWFISHSGSKDESHGHFILSCSDGGFLQIGETGDISKASKLLAIKTNGNGDFMWSQEISTGEHNLGNSAIELNDGYLVCGAQDKNSSIIKLSTSGDIIWNRTFDNGGSDAFEHVAKSSNGFIAVGYINAEDDLNTFYTEGTGYIAFLNNVGEKISGKNIDLSHPYRIKLHSNNYIVSGLSDGASDYGLMKIDSLGSTIWTKTFGGSKDDHCFGMDISSDGSIYLTGHTLSGTENWDTYTMKISSIGVKQWEVKKGNPRGFKPKFIHDEAWGVKATNDGGCIVVAGTGDEYGRYRRRCGTDGDNSNTWHVYLIKFDASGSLEWQRTYGGPKKVDWAGEDIDLTNDGGAIIAVDNGEFGFLKIDPF